MTEYELNDSDADAFLLAAPGATLLIFVSATCATCRVARARLPGMDLPLDRLCWVDAGRNGGLVQRYEVFHLPALFVVREGELCAPLAAPLTEAALAAALPPLLAGATHELP
jgi:thioredoxin 1